MDVVNLSLSLPLRSEVLEVQLDQSSPSWEWGRMELQHDLYRLMQLASGKHVLLHVRCPIYPIMRLPHISSCPLRPADPLVALKHIIRMLLSG